MWFMDINYQLCVYSCFMDFFRFLCFDFAQVMQRMACKGGQPMPMLCPKLGYIFCTYGPHMDTYWYLRYSLNTYVA